MKYYLAGPMSGLPQHNFPAFIAAAESLRRRGYDVVSPVELDGAEVQKAALEDGVGAVNVAHGDTIAGHTRGELMGRDVQTVLDVCDAVIVLPGWNHSRGACLEVFTAFAYGKPVYEYSEVSVALRRLDCAVVATPLTTIALTYGTF